MKDKVLKAFSSNAALVAYAAELMAPQIVEAAAVMREAIDGGHKILICGNGGSAAHAQHLAAELVGRFRYNRDPIPAIALSADSSIVTAVGNDYGFDNIFTRQVWALASPGDVLVAITTSGGSGNIWRAAATANSRGAKVIGITRQEPTRLREEVLRANGCMITVPSTDTARIQELHQLAIHCLCELIEDPDE